MKLKDGKKRFALPATWLLWLTGFAVISVMACLYVWQPLLLRQIDNRLYDMLLLARPRITPSPVPVIIDIDEEALEEHGQWPWSRHLLASIARAAIERGATAVAFDVLLAEPDRTSPVRLAERLELYGMDISDLPDKLADHDEMLARAIEHLPVVLGMYARFGSEGSGGTLPGLARTGAMEHNLHGPRLAPRNQAGVKSLPEPVPYLVISSPGAIAAEAYLHKATDATVPLPLFQDAAPAGLINMSPDSDGYVRRVPLISLVDGKAYVSLSVRALMAATGKDTIILRTGPDGLESIRIGDYTVPVTPRGDFIVPYTGPSGEYPYVSAARLLDGSLPDDAFNGHILFIGTSAPGLLDIRSMPFDRIYPGVEVHASVLDAMLTGRSLSIPPWTPGLQIFCILAAGGFSGLCFLVARPWIYIATGCFLIAAIMFGSHFLFSQGMFVSPLYPVLTVCLQGGFLLCLRFRQEEKRKNILRSAFSRYVAPEVVKRIAEQGGDILSGEERELSIMFTDIRGFTSISEKLTPPQVVSLLNRYFTPMTAIVRNHSGTLDKFIGDALMAFWNAPLPVENHAIKAIEAALAMQREVRELNASLKSEFGCEIHMGAGINTGKVYVGNMGSEDLVNYTLIGDSVNLASRLEGLCSRFGVDIVVNSAVIESCGKCDRFDFMALDTLRVKGREQPVSVFTVITPGERSQRAEEFGLFEQALVFYRNGDFELARKNFSALRRAHPDRLVYSVYARRVSALLRDPPLFWDGVWTLDAK